MSPRAVTKALLQPVTLTEVLPIDKVRPDPHNLRRDIGDVDELARSITSLGLLEPLLVCPAGDGTYTVIAGHRRLAACQKAGLSDVRCEVRDDLDEAGRTEAQLVENLRREDLSPLEEAEGYRRLAALGLSQTAIAGKVGCNQSHVSKRLKLLEVPEVAREALHAGGITIEQALELHRLAEHPKAVSRALAEVKERPWVNVGNVVDSELRAVNRQAALDALSTKLRDKGVAVLKERPSYNDRKVKEISQWNGVDVDAKKHEAEPCHAVFVDVGYGDAQARAHPYCTDPARHNAKGASTLKAKKKATLGPRSETPAERARREAEDKAAEERRVQITALFQRRLPKAAAQQLCLQAFVDERLDASYGDELDPVVRLLALPTPAEADPKARGHQPDWQATAVQAHAAKGETQLLQVALALAVADAEPVFCTWADAAKAERVKQFLEDHLT